MPKNRTYTFRGPAALAERFERARAMLARPDDEEVDIAYLVAKEFERRLGELRDSGVEIATQSELIRAAIELVAGASAKVANDLDWADLYAEEPPREWEDQEWLAAVLGSRRHTAA